MSSTKGESMEIPDRWDEEISEDEEEEEDEDTKQPKLGQQDKILHQHEKRRDLEYTKKAEASDWQHQRQTRPDKTVSAAKRMIARSLGYKSEAARLTPSELEYEKSMRNKLRREREAKKEHDRRAEQLAKDVWEK